MNAPVIDDAAAAAPVRWVVLDVARGVAIVLMVLDHVLAQTDPLSPLRLGSPIAITRLSLPLFMFAAAGAWRPGRLARRAPLLLVVVLEAELYGRLGMGQPGIVALFCVVLLVVELGLHPYVYGVLGLVQALYVPLGLHGYEPGLVLAWWALGRLAWLTWPPVTVLGRWSRPVAAIGRWPLTWYVGHLAAIAVVVAVV